ncbi:hypothetical protein ACFQZE_07110 [Paenibacillus sp. GCM10027627]|uniref:hypothetical protein n=1 Tax=unclassified Paenibacillus TaxID=185978 RepID=UPI0036325D98
MNLKKFKIVLTFSGYDEYDTTMIVKCKKAYDDNGYLMLDDVAIEVCVIKEITEV